jgi:hypothetical protein
MKAFIFQSLQDRFDLRSKLLTGERKTWRATRYQSIMDIGDLIFFWMGGEPEIRGIYGWGSLTSKAYSRGEWDTHGVDAVCEHRLDPPLLARELVNDAQLRNMLILRVPIGTNFLLELKEATRLASILSARGQPAPQITSDHGE